MKSVEKNTTLAHLIDVANPSSIEAVIAAGWQTLVCPGNIDTSMVVAQVELTGNPFHRSAAVSVPHGTEAITTEREVRIIAGFGNGDNVFVAINDTVVIPQDLVHEKLADAGTLYDHALTGGRQLTTVQKHGSSTSHVDTQKAIRERGGNPDHKMPKPAGSFSTKPLQITHR